MSSKERPCILLVEDDRLTRTVLRHDLKLHGFEGAKLSISRDECALSKSSKNPASWCS